MKKLIAVIAVVFATMTMAHAQFGVVGGFTSSKTNLKDVELKNLPLWHAGVAYKFEIGPVFCIQPALAYQVKGTKVKNTSGETVTELELKTGYVELLAGLQVGIDLAVIRPFALFEPFIGYQVTGNEKWDSSDWKGSITGVTNKFEYGFGVGGGIELFDHVQLSVQWFKNLGNIYKGDPPIEAFKKGNFQGIKVTLGLFF